MRDVGRSASTGVLSGTSSQVGAPDEVFGTHRFRCQWSRVKTSTAQVGGPNAGRRLIPKTMAKRARYCTSRPYGYRMARAKRTSTSTEFIVERATAVDTGTERRPNHEAS